LTTQPQLNHLPTSPPANRHEFEGWFDNWLSKENYRPPRRGEVLPGEVLVADGGAIIVDIGAKRDAIIPPDDLRQVDAAILGELSVGDEVPVCVVQPVNDDGNLIVSLSRGLEQQDWLRAKQVLDSGEICEARVSGYNKGGLLVEFGSLQAFMPNSLVTGLGRNLAPEALERAKAQMIGQAILMKIIEVNRANRRLVGSQRAAERSRRSLVLQSLEPEQVVTGRVVNLVAFGAFVDLGGVDGLLHISELAWNHVQHPSEVLQVGQEIEVMVLEINRERERIRLSRKRLPPRLGDSEVERGMGDGGLHEQAAD
jgi:small subunit ribosomal protein S1